MRGKQRRYKKEPLKRISDINMTPLIDITFLLLIAFLITFPLMENAVEIKLPKANTNQVDPAAPKPHNLAIDAAGVISLDNAVLSLEDLEAELTRRVLADPQTAVIIRGDEAINYGQLMKVVAILNKARVTRMALVSNAEAPK